MSERPADPRTEAVPCPDGDPPRATRRRVAEVLRGGGLVALPTECGYALAGLPARAERLAARAAPDAPLARLVAERGAVEEAAHLRPLLRRLAERYWPGPLVLVVDGADDAELALRCPAQSGTLACLRELDRAPVAVALRGADGAALASPEAAAEAGPDLVADGGKARLAELPAVLRVGLGRFELRREGLLQPSELRATAGLAIGFVCTGNTCRSPMAEALARSALARRLGAPDLARFGFRLLSAGVAAEPGAPPSEHAVQVLAARGVDLARHRARPAVPEAIAALDRVYCLTAAHRAALVALLPPSRARTVELLDPDGRDVPDPIGRPVEEYVLCAERVGEAVERRLDEWA